ncbi:MAG: hypothetical protein LBS49_03400 [Candidatus Accumulibacter sp.]|nr:hypothetical protein [Accumulibacter sp.]
MKLEPLLSMPSVFSARMLFRGAPLLLFRSTSSLAGRNSLEEITPLPGTIILPKGSFQTGVGFR